MSLKTNLYLLDSPLTKMDNVLLGTHNANSSPKAWERVHQNTIDNLLDGLGIYITEGKLTMSKNATADRSNSPHLAPS